jgi:phosphodiesterase/alkaline phosphatase D-like protein
MCKKLHPLVSLLMVLAMITGASAATQYAIWQTAGRDWFTPTDWSIGAVPTINADYLTSGKYGVTTYNSTGPDTGPLITSGDANVVEIKIGGANGKINTGYLTIEGGTLSTENWIMVGPDGTVSGGKNGAFVIEGGTVTVGGAAGGVRTNGHLYVPSGFSGNTGTPPLTGTVTMTGGILDVGGTLTVVRYAGAAGYIYLNGGTIQTHAISMQEGGHFDISGGTLIVDGDATGTLNTYKTNGWLTGYGQSSGVQISYDAPNPGKTTVTGVTGGVTRASNPIPETGSSGIMLNPTLSWDAGLNTVSYNVYFGTISPGTLQSDPNSTDTIFTPAGPLAANTTYYWRVDSVGESSTVEGFVWMFTTGSPKASNPSPANSATQVTINPTLSWTPGAGAISHDVYLGTANPPVSFVNVTVASYSPATLATDTTYYWRVNERDSFGGVAIGDIWSFTTASSIRKGPYLIYPGNNTQMTVLWQLPSTQNCTLQWGMDTSYTAGSLATTEYGADHQHKYTITGLTPGTKYYYRVIADTGTFAGSFRSAPAADANSVKFIAYGDTRTNPDQHAALMTQLNSTIAADNAFQTILMHSGDWVNTADEAHWTSEYFNRSYPSTLQMQANMPIIGGLGNHEINGDGISVFDKYWPFAYAQPANGRYYSFDYGPVHIAVVDMETAAYNAGSAQIQWLASDLANSTKKWKIVMFHEPAWCAGGSHPNNATAQTDIEPILEQNGVQVVFAGHNHSYSRAVVNGIHHVTSGAGGAPFYTPSAGQPNIVTYTANKLEFCKVEVTDNSMGVTAITDQGEVIDSFYVNNVEPDLTFVQVTDVQIGMESSQNCPGQAARWQTAVDRINMLNPAFVIDTGDHVQSWSVSSPYTASLNSYLSIASNIKPTIPLYHAPGNHDIGDAPAPNRYPSFLTVFPNPFPASSSSSVPWYSFSYGNTLFICLDTVVLKNPSSYVGEDAAQMNWLTNTLQNSSGYAHKIVFTHVPICKSSVTEPDDPGGFNMPSTPGNSRAYANIRAELLSLFHQYGVEVVFSGHAHVPYSVNDNGLELITTETTTCPLGGLSTDTCGIMIVKIFPDHIEHEYRCLNCFIIPQPLPGDFNGDGIVDNKDLGIFVDYWLDNGIWPE